MSGEVIDRALDGDALPQRLEMLHQQFRLERGGVVVVDPGSLGEIEIRLMQVVGIMLEKRHLTVETLDHRGGDGGLPGARSTGDADEQRTVRLPGSYIGHGCECSGLPPPTRPPPYFSATLLRRRRISL